MRELGIYVHVPFCLGKCAYCDFYSGAASEEEREAYVKAVISHILAENQSLKGRNITTVFFGGGTPSLLTPSQFARILNALATVGTLSPDAEISLEANPATMTREGMRELRLAGANRISIGLQSAADRELKLLGRLHTRSQFEESYRDCRAAGFSNINVDLMYGIPAQTEASFDASLTYLLGLGPEHISSYCLKLEDGTPMAKNASLYRFPDEDAVADLYELMCARLRDGGYEHYEISNFAKPGHRCRHNMKYWTMQEYLGFGPAAHSYFDSCRFYYAADRRAYENPATRQKIKEENAFSAVSVEEEMEETVMLAMRLSDGIDLAAFRRRFGVEFDEIYGSRLRPFLSSGHVRPTARGYAFSDGGMFVSNAILSEIL